MPQFRVLFVDDDPDFVLIVSKILEDQYEVVTAQNGLDALSRVERIEPDIVLADVMMPVMNGWEFVERLRQIPELKQTPVIFLSALSQRHEIKSGYESGANMYLVKPIDPDRLLRMLKMQLDEKGGYPRPKTHSIDELKKMETTEPARSAAEKRPPSEKETASAGTSSETKTQEEAEVVPRILIVDDDRDFLRLLSMHLERDYEVYTADDGLEAMDEALKWQPDIFVLDWMLPKVSGYQMVEILRRSRNFQKAPIIFISAKSSPKERQMVERLGVKKFLPKPFTPEKLSEAIRETVESPDFELNPHHPPWERKQRTSPKSQSAKQKAPGDIEWEG